MGEVGIVGGLRDLVWMRRGMYDPLLSDELIGVGVEVSDDPDAKVDCVIVTVAHDEFREMGLLDVEGFDYG